MIELSDRVSGVRYQHKAGAKVIRKRIFGLALCAMLLALCYSASAQQPAKIPRVAFISTSDTAVDSGRFDGIRQRLRELGYVEGQNIAIDYRTGGAKLERYHNVVAELVRLVDIIVVGGGTTYVQVVKKATKTIPIVMTGPGGDPVEAGLIDSLARPGDNVTGLINLARDLGGKRLELLKEAVPKVAQVAILYDPANPAHQYELKEVLAAAARALKLTLQPWEVRASNGFEKVFASIAKQRPDGLYALGGPLMIANRKRIADFALKNRLPSTDGGREAVEAGGLMSYGADQAENHRRVAYFVDKILKGAKPADLPVEQPAKFELVINLKTAKQIGVTIQQSLLYRADKVIR
jgi:putative tryptophan/tyrosine transport system substrate-binding protein